MYAFPSSGLIRRTFDARQQTWDISQNVDGVIGMNRQMTKWASSAVLIALLTGNVLPAAAQWTWTIGARISIVFPQDGQGRATTVTQARAINVSVWPSGQIRCGERPNLSLLIAKDNEPTRLIETLPASITRTAGSVIFSSFEYNDLPANLASDPTSKYQLVLYTPVPGDKQGFSGNIWVHGADPRTFNPTPIAPAGFSATPLPAPGLDTRIQIVWPHDNQGNFAAVERATKLNIAVEVFEHGTTKAIPPGPDGKFQYTVGLWVAPGNDALRAASYTSLTPLTYTIANQIYTRWTFNDIPVDPDNPYHFLSGATPKGSPNVYPYTSIWTHAADPRTMMPRPQVPPACIP